MKIRTAMRSVMAICEVRSDECTAPKIPGEIEVIYAGPEEKEMSVCTACMHKKLVSGEWSMWYWRESASPTLPLTR